MSVAINEQETTIGWYRDSNECFVYTSDTTVMTKLDKLVSKSNKWTLEKVERDAETHEIVGKHYQTNKRLICFRSDIVKCNQTEEQKKASAQRLKIAKEQRRQNQK